MEDQVILTILGMAEAQVDNTSADVSSVQSGVTDDLQDTSGGAPIWKTNWLFPTRHSVRINLKYSVEFATIRFASKVEFMIQQNVHHSVRGICQVGR